MRTLRIAAGALAAAAALAAFSRSPQPALNDERIVGIIEAANVWDSTTGTLASTKASRSDVRAFGSVLRNDHGTVNQRLHTLASNNGITPIPPAPSFALRVDFEATMKKLNALSGPAFDSAFLAHEVAYHQAVIEAMKTQFLPAIHNGELHEFVVQLGPAFEAHLKAAENLQMKK